MHLYDIYVDEIFRICMVEKNKEDFLQCQADATHGAVVWCEESSNFCLQNNSIAKFKIGESKLNLIVRKYHKA